MPSHASAPPNNLQSVEFKNICQVLCQAKQESPSKRNSHDMLIAGALAYHFGKVSTL
jgi:hypothetical protein